MKAKSAIVGSFDTDLVGDYEILEELCDGSDSRVCRARRIATGESVILKICRQHALAKGGLARYKSELKIMQAVNGKSVARCFGLEQTGDTVMLVLEDIGGRSLAELIRAHPPSLKEALVYAARIADGLSEIHNANVIHKDLNPSNIVYNAQSGELRIIDFGASTILSREQQAIVDPGLLVGTLTYISPEQTGRMNRAIDYRSDFYSLGVTLYEMLTGAPPFVAEDPLDLVHMHIAKPPICPSELNTMIPRAVGDIVLKLLTKTAEDRYQSAFGIKTDLEECVQRLEQKGGARARTFTLAANDRPHQFRVPQKLYGREKKIKLLLSNFDKVANGGREILLIGGYSGIGKTSLVREIYKPITERRGYFIAGKFNQFQRAPFKALFDALRELIKQLLTENEEQLAYWRATLQKALGQNGQLIVDVFPEIELIIGPQPPLSKLGPTETQNRMNLVLTNLVQAFCRPQHPLVIFLDDVQWIDSSSLAFVLRLLGDESIRYLMIIGAYRNNEVDQTHPFMMGLQAHKNSGGIVETLVLEPLRLPHVRALVTETLRCEEAEAEALAELIVQKTDGNPFFVEEFLKSLYAEGLLSFDGKRGRWTWDLSRIHAQRITDNVADLMAQKLERLDLKTKRVLSLAACLGGRFDLFTLSTIYRASPSDTIEALHQALELGLIDPIGSSSGWLIDGSAIDENQARKIECQFSHDRVQSAAYALIHDRDKPRVHKTIAELLLADSAHDIEAKVFDIVEHFNCGIREISGDQQIKMLTELTLRVAQIAKYSGANDTAYKYLKNVIELFPDEYWKTDYELIFKAHVAAAEAALGVGNYAEMNRLCEIAQQHAAYVLDRVQVYEIKITADFKRNRFLSAIALGIDALKRVGFRLPAKPTRLDVWFGLLRTRWTLYGKSDEELLAMTKVAEPISLAQRRLSVLTGDAAYWANVNLFMVNIFKAIRVVVQHGEQLSPGRLAAYGMILGGWFGDLKGGYRYAALALRMVDQTGHPERGRTFNIFYSNACHWRRPVNEARAGMLSAYQHSLDSGQPYWAASAAMTYCYMSLFCANELIPLDGEFTTYKEIVRRKLQYLGAYDHISLYHRGLRNMIEESNDPCRLEGEGECEDDLLRRWAESRQHGIIYSYHFLKVYLAFNFGRYDEAVKHGERMKPLTQFVAAAYGVIIATFYDSLARLALCSTAKGRQRRQLLREVERNRKLLKKLAEHAPMNYLHKLLLVDGERENVFGNDVRAMNAYEQAIALARKNEHLQDEGLANELASKFHLARGRKSVASSYLRQAVICYQTLGAKAKVEYLRAHYPQLLGVKESPVATIPFGATVVTGFNFDLHALVKALKGIAEEKSHGQLLQKTILTAMELAGADAAVLILRKTADNFFIEAQVSIEEKAPQILQSIPLEEAKNVSHAVLNYVKRTGQSVVINVGEHAEKAIPGIDLDPRIKSGNAKSILCIPLLVESNSEPERLIGLLYLENSQASNTFDEQRIETLGILCLAATGRLDLSRKAMTDGLTGLYNHDTFENMLHKEFSGAQRNQRKLSVIMVDIDHFKKFNDEWGHQLGDTVLKEVANTVKRSCRDSDIVTRYGGEEMAVVLPDTDTASVLIVAERIRTNVEAMEVAHNSSLLKVTVSLGVSTISPSTQSSSALFKCADEALYVSKREGRNRVSVR